MSGYDFDLFVIGAGSGGVRASRMAASFGAKVAVAEDRYLGGTCVNVGCVPKKLFVYAAEFAKHFSDARGFGWDVAPSGFDWARLRDNKTAEIERLNGIYAGLLGKAGVTTIWGRATVTGPHSVAVDGKTYTAERILIAVGGWPVVPEIPGKELGITSNEVFSLEAFPERVLIVGGGYVAVEFAGIFNGLGAAVTQVYRRDLFLRGFDREIAAFLAEEMRKKDVDLRFNTDVTALERAENGAIRARLNDGTTLETDLVFFATGRAPNTRGLGLEEVGVGLDAHGAVGVDGNFQTMVPSIHAIGDVIARPYDLTPVAIGEGMALAHRLYGPAPRDIAYDFIPTAIFSQPTIGTVGLSEADARARYGAIDVYAEDFRPMKHTLSGDPERMFMKLIVDKASDRVIGLHMVGEGAGEILQGMAVAMKAGATKAVFDATVGIHPTAAEEFVTMRTPRADPDEARAAE